MPASEKKIDATTISPVVSTKDQPEELLRVPFHRPSIGDDEIASVVQTMESGWLTTGPKVKQFEANFAEAVQADFAIAVNSATAALHLALEALGIGPGDEVLVPTLTFAATAEVVIHLGAKPVLVDCEPGTLNIDPADAAKRITPHTKAIMPVHYAGHPCDMTAILALAKKHDLFVVEDAAHSFPASYEGAPIGSIGDITCFSFYANKTITTGEGGMITTNDETLADRMRMMSLHGLSRGAWNRFKSPRSWSYDIQEAGFKYNMPDLAAAIGIEQLARAEQLCDQRQQYAERYTKHFSRIAGITPLEVAPQVAHAWHLYVVQIDQAVLGVNRDRFLELLDDSGIGTSVHYRPLHMHSYYEQQYGYQSADLPQAEQAFHAIISLPLYPGMTNEMVDLVVHRIEAIVTGLTAPIGLSTPDESTTSGVPTP